MARAPSCSSLWTSLQHSPAELGDAEQTHLFGDESEKPKRHAWAWLLGKMFVVDVTARSTATERQARFGAHADREGRSRDSLPATGRAASALPQEEWLEVCTESRDIQRVLAAHGLAPRAPPAIAWAPLGQLRLHVLTERRSAPQRALVWLARRRSCVFRLSRRSCSKKMPLGAL